MKLRRMKQRRLVVGAALAALAFATYSGIAWQRRTLAAEVERYDEKLRSLLALDFRLTGEVMKARSGLVLHYDGLVQTEQATKAHVRALARVPSGFDDHQRDEIATMVAERVHEQESVQALVERWKSANAVLRNSLHFLPRAAVALDTALDAAAAARPSSGDAGAGAEHEPASSPLVLRREVDTLVRDLLLLQSVEDPAVLDRINRASSALSSRAPDLSEDLRHALELVLMHAAVVIRWTPIVNVLTRDIVHSSLPALTERLMATHAAAVLEFRDARSADLGVLFALALATLLLGAAAIIMRMRLSAAELRMTSAQLEEAIASLRVEQEKERELSLLKTRFVAMTSHEFRTPLSMIMSSSEMLAAYGNTWPAEKTAKHHERIKDAVIGMTNMLDSILLIGRSDAGMLGFTPAPMNIAKLCSEAVEAVQAGIEARCVVENRLPPDEVVVGDETLLRHVLSNLLSNAIKYSPSGTPVQLTVHRDGSDVLLAVQDRGIGIAPDDRKRLFDTFHRGKNVGNVAGSGLGLAIVKRAIELHGGALSVETELGVGSTFVARVPAPGVSA